MARGVSDDEHSTSRFNSQIRRRLGANLRRQKEHAPLERIEWQLKRQVETLLPYQGYGQEGGQENGEKVGQVGPLTDLFDVEQTAGPPAKEDGPAVSVCACLVGSASHWPSFAPPLRAAGRGYA